MLLQLMMFLSINSSRKAKTFQALMSHFSIYITCRVNEFTACEGKSASDKHIRDLFKLEQDDILIRLVFRLLVEYWNTST